MNRTVMRCEMIIIGEGLSSRLIIVLTRRPLKYIIIYAVCLLDMHDRSDLLCGRQDISKNYYCLEMSKAKSRNATLIDLKCLIQKAATTSSVG